MRVKFSFRSFVGEYLLLAHIVIFCSLSHASVPFECEAALSGPAQTFIRLLDEGLKPSKGQPALISKANLQAMSAENLNPLVNEVRTSANASLKAAFSKLSTQIQANEAKAILSHVNKILGIRQIDEALKQESQIRTAPIFAPAKVFDLDITRIIGPGTVGLPHMHLDRDGRPIIALAANNPSRRIELLTFDNFDRSDFTRQSIELGFTQEVRFFSDSRRDLWAAFVGPSRTAGNQIEVRNLTSRESFTATSPGAINEMLNWFEDKSGKIFLVALQSDRVADGQYKLEIFELTSGGLKSIFNLGLRNKISWELHSSKSKELFVTAVDQDHVLQTWSLNPIEKISQWKISPESIFQPFVASSGEVVVAVTDSGTSLEPNKFYRSGHPEPILSLDLDNYASRVWHETDDGRLLFATQVRLDGLPKLALYEPFNVQTQDKWQPKFLRVRKFLRQSVPSAYSFTKPLSTYTTENLVHQKSRWIQMHDGSWIFIVNSAGMISGFGLDLTGALQKHFAINLNSNVVGSQSTDELELVQDPATKEWIVFRWSEWNRALAVISLSSSAAGSRPVSLGKSDLKFSKPMLTDDGQVYMSDIELILDNSQLGARLLLNIYRITGRLP